jgi:hypothetical protein
MGVENKKQFQFTSGRADGGRVGGGVKVLVCLRKKSTEADSKACFETGVSKGY